MGSTCTPMADLCGCMAKATTILLSNQPPIKIKFLNGLSKFKKTEIISSSFSKQNSMKLEIDYKKKTGKHKRMETKEHATKQPMN